MKLHYRLYGKGPLLIILHGLYGSSDNWVTIAKRLSSDFTVCLPDLRNHGQSPHSVIHDYDSMRDDIHELTADLGLTGFFLAGHSMGGKVAAAFAIEHPEMIQGLLVGDISPFSGGDNHQEAYDQHLSILRAVTETDLSELQTRNDVDRELSKSISSEKIRALVMKNLKRTTENSFRWKLNAGSLLSNLSNIMEDLPVPSAASMGISGFPVVFLKGENSGYISSAGFRGIQRIFPAAELKVIRNAGHWLHVDNPDDVIAAITGLLNY